MKKSSKIIDAINTYLDFNIGNLKWVNPNPGFNSKDYVQFYNESGKVIMDGIIGKELLVSEQLYDELKNMFNLKISEFEEIMTNWCEDNFNLHFPEIVIDDSEESLGYINQNMI
jgi:hypothetical protein